MYICVYTDVYDHDAKLYFIFGYVHCESVCVCIYIDECVFIHVCIYVYAQMYMTMMQNCPSSAGMHIV